MSDEQTLGVYDSRAAQYADQWLGQDSPGEIYEVVQKYFRPHSTCADIGSGSGRDVAWLHDHGWSATGFDASTGLLSEARKRFPGLPFRQATLPKLAEIPKETFEHVTCETVLMHLPANEHIESLKNLLRILRPGGVLHLAWRLPFADGSARDSDGRLYQDVDTEALKEFCLRHGAEILEERTFASQSSGRQISHLVIRKAPSANRLLQLLTLYVAIWGLLQWFMSSRLTSEYHSTVFLILLAGPAMFWIAHDGQRWEWLSPPTPTRRHYRWLGMTAIFAAVAVAILKFTGAPDPFMDAIARYGFLYVYLTSCLSTPILEELFFRQAVQSTLRRYLKTTLPLVLASAALFALYHLTWFDQQYLAYISMQFGATLVLGILFAQIRLASGSLLWSILAHIGYNSLVLFGAWLL